MTKFKMSDAIIGRVISIIQESFISGVDVLDLFRQMEMQPDSTDEHVLVLTDEYKAVVDKWHEEIEGMLREREAEAKAQGTDVKGVIAGTGETGHTGGSFVVQDPNFKKVN